MAVQGFSTRFAAYRANVAGRNLLRQLLQSRLVTWRYGGGSIEQLVIVPQDLRTADPSFASEIYHGHFGLAGSIAATGSISPFQVRPPNVLWLRELHGFGWLRHLRAADDQISREHARALLRDWIEIYEPISGLPWRPEIVARRVISWLSHAPIVLEGAEESFYDQVMRSLARQLRYLRASHRKAPEGAPRLLALVALLLGGLCAAGRDAYVDQHVEGLRTELDRQILADGGHVSRNPGLLIELLLDLLPLRQCFLGRDRDVPPALIGALDRMLPMLRFFRLGDGSLARFNGTGATALDLLAILLAYDDVQGRTLRHAASSGYARLARGDVALVADVGHPPPFPVSGTAHAGCLAFEMSVGQHLLIVNCGAPAPVDMDWVLPSRSTAAHSTLAICDTSSAELVSVGSDGLAQQPGLIGAAASACEIVEENGEVVIRAVNEGYKQRFGIVHERTLRLSPTGERVSGIDRLQAPAGLRGVAKSEGAPFTIRFHLHPSVRAQLSQDGRTALLVTPGRQGWRLTAGEAPLSVEESVYLADIVGPRRTLQIVINGAMQGLPEIRVAWTIERSKGSLPVGLMPEDDSRSRELPLL